ncbi:DUF4430 domain-containing protein [Patescibacteria group bacterium]|nr:DUF4430 domain-containing protein [Patescibacteria group bacterium]
MKISLKIFILIAVLIVGFFLVQYLVEIEAPPTEVRIEEEIKVSLLFDFGEGNVKNFKDIELREKKTVFDLLKKVTQENNLEFSFKEYPNLGVFIESIDSFANDSKRNLWWQYWVNNEYVQVGAGDYQLKNGDLVEWKYIESQL